MSGQRSRLLTGALDPDRARGLIDASGTTYSDAMAWSGRSPHLLTADPQAMARIGTIIELHVEQGRGLIDADAPVGIAGDIWPHGRRRFTFSGRADHAGTTPMDDRNDPMVTYAVTAPTSTGLTCAARLPAKYLCRLTSKQSSPCLVLIRCSAEQTGRLPSPGSAVAEHRSPAC